MTNFWISFITLPSTGKHVKRNKWKYTEPEKVQVRRFLCFFLVSFIFCFCFAFIIKQIHTNYEKNKKNIQYSPVFTLRILTYRRWFLNVTLATGKGLLYMVMYASVYWQSSQEYDSYPFSYYFRSNIINNQFVGTKKYKSLANNFSADISCFFSSRLLPYGSLCLRNRIYYTCFPITNQFLSQTTMCQVIE